jgi:hypothetical protein
MTPDFQPIILRYEGLEADAHVIDLFQLGQSIQGASRLIGSAGSIVITGQFAKRAPALSVRVLAGPPQAHCYEFAAIIATISPAAVPMLPIIKDAAQNAASKAVTGIVNFALARFGGRMTEAGALQAVAIKAMEEVGHTSRAAIEAMERVVTSQRPAARLFASPVGQSCAIAQIGRSQDGAVAIDKATRDAIDAPETLEVGPTAVYEILISELDLKNRTCKFALRDDDNDDARYNGEITDPVIRQPHNPYSAALDDQKWIPVKGKPQLKDGDIERLYISDLASLLTLPPR